MERYNSPITNCVIYTSMVQQLSCTREAMCKKKKNQSTEKNKLWSLMNYEHYDKKAETEMPSQRYGLWQLVAGIHLKKPEYK